MKKNSSKNGEVLNYCHICLKFHDGSCLKKKGHKNKYARGYHGLKKDGKSNTEYKYSGENYL